MAISSVSIVVKRECKYSFSRNNVFFLSIIQTECLCLLDYAEGVARTGIGLMNADQQGKIKVTLCHWEKP